MTYVAPSSPLSIGGVLDNWIRLFSASFSRCWALALVSAAATAALQLLITPPLALPHQNPLDYLQQGLSSMRAAGLLYVLSWLIGLVVYGALLAQQVAVMRGNTPLSFAGALGSALRRLPQMLLAGVLMLLIVAAVCLPIGIGAALLIGAHDTGHASGWLTLGVVSSSFALTLVLIYLSVRLEFWLPALFVEDCGGAAALGHSWRLVKGHWWRVTMITFVAVVIITILSMAINWTAGLVGGAFGLHAINALTDPAQFIRRMRVVSAIAASAGIVTLPLLTAVWLSIYHDLKLRREGGDLAARAEALSGT